MLTATITGPDGLSSWITDIVDTGATPGAEGGGSSASGGGGGGGGSSASGGGQSWWDKATSWVPQGGGGQPGTTSLVPGMPAMEPWYENWKIWAGIGGVVVLGSVLLLRRR